MPASRAQRRAVLAGLWAVLVVTAPPCAGAMGAERTVVVGPGETVRDLAERHLGNADLWRDLLAANDLASASEVKPGAVLRVPDLPIAEARAVLAATRPLIREAAALGASVFAPEVLREATDRRDEAVRDGKLGHWADALAHAQAARRLATEARDLTRRRRQRAGQAVLTARRGQVQGRRAEALVWTERPIDAVLVENERLRTLSDSHAEVRFSDESQIRLGANAQVVIQSMQVDHLNDRRQTTVSLVEGDAFALLGGGGRRDFDVRVESVDAHIDSKNFWVRREGDDAKYANYDDRPVRVSAGRGEVTLGWNQGTTVSPTDGPTAPKDLLPPPERVLPADDSEQYRETVLLRWVPVDGAASYSVEVDRDARFLSPVLAPTEITGAAFAASGLGRGTYYWRVRAVDELGFPGAASRVGRFRVEAEGAAPYLLVASPASDGPTGERTWTIHGETDPGATVVIDGHAVPVDGDGRFRRDRTLRAGPNSIVVVAASPAGLTTREERHLEYVPGWFAPIDYDPALSRLGPRHFVTRGETVVLSGATAGDAAVHVVREDGVSLASTRTDSSGGFRLAVTVPEGRTELRTRVTSASGFTTEEQIVVTRDSEPPRLHLAFAPPAITDASEIVLEGRAEPGATVDVDGARVSSRDGRFSVRVALAPGENDVLVVATDAAGNVSERRLRVLRDEGAPVVEGIEWSRDAEGRVDGVRIAANDPAGLCRVGGFRWKRAGEVHEGTLRLAPDGRTYVGRLRRNASDVEPTIVSVDLEDRAGNRRRREF